MEHKDIAKTTQGMDCELKRQLRNCLLIFAALCLAYMCSPDMAWAETGLVSMLQSLQGIVRGVLLPLGILISGARIAYLATFGVIGGIDPLGLIDDGGDSIQTSQAVNEIKKSLDGFVRGLCWVGGIWILFEIILTLAIMLANGLSGSVG